MDVWARDSADPDAITEVLGRLFSEGGVEPEVLDYNARLVTALRERQLWPRSARR